MATHIKTTIEISDALLDEAEKLSRLGFGVADAVHLAAAARLKVDVFLSVDEKLVRRGRQNAQQFSFRVLNPVKFLEECDDAANG